ncbi:Chromate resistance protein ChrB [Kribbella sp. HUAS MG21]|uniref:Chromate resistance protein ChrB n=1 Tax=Kribbella sp. HUAS MG21 TaxID=3160966 RepID=A0AAU7T9Z9_9ACTN
MTDRWLVLVVRVPAEPSRHRVAVWRELRKAGALSLGQGVWAVPELPVFEAAVRRTTELVERAEGEATVLAAAGREAADGARLRALYDEARRADWAEYLRDSGKFEDEIAKEIRIGKFTLAELEEEEQSLERLRRWHRDLTSRDVFGTPESEQATARLKVCVARCEEYAELVFRALHQLPGDER